MLKGLKYCLLALIFIIIIIFFVVRSAFKANNDLVSLFDQVLGREKKVAPLVLKEEKTLRIIEGWRNRDISDLLEKNNLATPDEFLIAQRKIDQSKFSFLDTKPKNTDLEGYLYPDTYRVYASSSASEIIDKMLANFDKKLSPQMRADIAAQGKTINEIITMASIIEKEAPISYATSDNVDAKIISGIFWRRLKSGQALQSCATLAYVLGVDKAQYSEADTKINSPYNTYRNPGLPPGPIANPGILAIEAAIYPTPSNYNYFLTPSGSSKIIYAATYEEHLRNKNKYLGK
ncbi:MAG: endolytic transglycosylase MltG [Candidatus Falkowbacteria bacterium]